MEAFVKIAGSDAVDVLVTAVTNQPRENVRRAATWGLGETGNVRAVGPLLTWIEDDSLKSSIAKALEKTGYFRTVADGSPDEA